MESFKPFCSSKAVHSNEQLTLSSSTNKNVHLPPASGVPHLRTRGYEYQIKWLLNGFLRSWANNLVFYSISRPVASTNVGSGTFAVAQLVQACRRMSMWFSDREGGRGRVVRRMSEFKLESFSATCQLLPTIMFVARWVWVGKSEDRWAHIMDMGFKLGTMVHKSMIDPNHLNPQHRHLLRHSSCWWRQRKSFSSTIY